MTRQSTPSGSTARRHVTRETRIRASHWLAVACLAALAQWPAQASANTVDEPEVLVDRVVELVRQHYVSTDKVEAVVTLLQAKRAAGHYRGLNQAEALARSLTSDLQAASQDKHNQVQVIHAKPAEPLRSWADVEREKEINSNFGFPVVQTFVGGIGYIRISSFMEPQRSAAVAHAAMAMTSPSRALIFDVRGNGGGYAGLPEYLASYFFEEGPTHLSTQYFTVDGQSRMSTTYTAALVPGSRRVGLPVFVLVDGKTGSAAEYFAYILQSFGKAKVVGARTSGAAHTNSYFPLTPTMRLSLSTGRPVSEANQRNWEGRGVEPDLECAPEAALDFALSAARAVLR